MSGSYSRARIVYSGKGELKTPEDVGYYIERVVYVPMSPVSSRTARIRINSVAHATPRIVLP